MNITSIFYKKWLLAFCLFAVTQASQASTALSQSPLVVSGGVPDNLVLLPSVEYPTINSVANLGDYSANKTYIGYFDSKKCYAYQYDADEKKRHFYPVGLNTTLNSYPYSCSTSQQYWSGNFLNWAATQTIDPFRLGLTGGYRVKDTVNETFLEKAWQDDWYYDVMYPDRRLPASGDNSTLVRQSVPFNKNYIQMRIHGLGNRMYFSLNNTNAKTATTITPYDPSVQTRSATNSGTYEVSIRVKVCVPNLLEANCVAYGSNYKPEGLLQNYSSRLRYSVFGYTNDKSNPSPVPEINKDTRDGAVLRARQKSIGPYLANLTSGVDIDNPNKEWDPNTGILIQNPDSADASATNTMLGITSIADSGVINYINKFGQMMTNGHKARDPVSEMYYMAIRYLRNLGNVSSYTSISNTLSATEKYKYADGFPIITDWTDPYLAPCQATAILGIGDIYTHRDKNLPGNTNPSYRSYEPTMPPEVANDTAINVVTLTNKIGMMEGLGNIGETDNFSGNNNSAFMAGLAWYANTRDLRPEAAMIGKQTASTYWVDVLENQYQAPPDRNVYWLATKYGGFIVPPAETYDPDTWVSSIPISWYNTTGQTITADGNTYKRPDNYFTAGEATLMVKNLRQAFNNLTSNFLSTGASLASVSSKLTTGNRIYQTAYFTRSWNSEILAYDIDPATGKFALTPTWKTSEKLPAWNLRNIRMSGDRRFQWSSMSIAEQSIFGSENLINYLRGDSTNEFKNDDTGLFRKRVSMLGDMIQSQAVVVGAPIDTLYVDKQFQGASSYITFAATRANRTPTLYVGGNDGMLHGFNAITGVETYAFVPSTVMPNMPLLAERNYEHRYFVDGEITAADVYLDGAWKTILVGSLGRGGKALFALDVTDPTDVKYLWEVNSTTVPALGNTLGKPLIVQTSNGTWQVVMGNGPNSADDKAKLVMIDIKTAVATVFDTGGSTNNGLTAVSAWSEQTNGIVSDLYAGDLSGNIWRFNLASNDFTKLFTAKDGSGKSQYITAAPAVGKDPLTNKRWVFFGTGRFWTSSDVTDTAQQTWYGIQDEGVLVNRNQLKQRLITNTGSLGNYDVRVIDTGSIADLTGYKGWYIDLEAPATNAADATPSERIIVPNFFQGDTLIGTTRIPSREDVCRPSGSGYIMAINAFPGTRLDRVFFDVNDDDKFDVLDQLTINNVPTIISGIGFDSSPHNPIFIDNLMEVVNENGSITTILTQGAHGVPSRTSWREVINQ
ncbi:pilus assembly protein [Thiolinea disciformis]|uniref:pilus assembly protein n=1 Tax=Thiolinea disciformis TaxID=125614 RepID=UPI00037D74CB|nr:PilC/PilY family type IV pilus protein [Thiolinea disciformis]